MTPERHSQAVAIFHQARELRGKDLDRFLDARCQDDAALRQEVVSLLKFDDTATFVADPTKQSFHPLPQHGQHTLRQSTGRFLSRIERVAAQWVLQTFASRANRWIVTVMAILLLGGLARWTHLGMRHATESIAAADLTTILNADVVALELWIEEKRKDVRFWSAHPEIQQAVVELAKTAEGKTDPAAVLRESPALTRLKNLFDKFDRFADQPEQDAVFSRDGRLLVAAHDDAIGRRLNQAGVAVLAPVFEGKTIFVKPHPDGAYSSDLVPDLQAPVVSVVAPIYDSVGDASRIVAACAFGFPADDEFTRILQVARQGETGETYAFDQNGLLLSESRFDDQLRQLGLLSKDPAVRSILRVEVRDPGADVNTSGASPVEVAARPLTKLAAEAVAAGRKGVASQQQGVILQPYRNYLGKQVVGAWKWLPDYEMGVATEVEFYEQFAPMRYPLVAEWIRFGLLAGSVLSLLIAASWISMLGRDLDRARKLGQYTLEDQIGEGGMGVVFRARHALLKRPTAIKLLRPEVVSKEALARFEREVQIASALTHPNTIEIFDFGPTPEGSFYCVMEFVAGQTLEEIVQEEGPLQASRVVNILRQISGSVGEAHQQHLVHRDLKPANIMLCQQGGIADFVKVLDFGLARTVDAEKVNITRTGLIAGTPPYLAPERITDPALIDPRSDIYSLGAVAYYLLTGRRTFDGASASEVLQHVLHENPPRPSEMTSNPIPLDLEELVMRCLARRPGDRPAAMAEISGALLKIAGE